MLEPYKIKLYCHCKKFRYFYLYYMHYLVSLLIERF